MSRLREAFEKARLRHHTASEPAKATTETSSGPSRLPQEWDFDLNPSDPSEAPDSTPVRFEGVEAIAPVDAREAGNEPGDVRDEQPQAPRDGASVVVELPPVVAQPRPREEFWHTYPFGQKSLGKVVVGRGADATLV